MIFQNWISMLMSLLIRYAHIPFLFSLFYYFLYINDPPLCTPTLMWLHVIVLALTSLGWSHIFDGHMIYDPLVFTSILSIPNVRPPAVWPITSPHTAWSGTYYSFALDEPYAHFLVYHLYLTCLYFTFCSDHHHRRARESPIQVSPRIEI